MSWAKSNPIKARAYARNYYKENREKVLRYGRNWRKKNRAKEKTRGRRYYVANREKSLASTRVCHLRKYGMTVASYAAMHRTQNGKCKICREPERVPGKRLSIDHNHSTGVVRGLLCNRCNIGVGKFLDNPKLLRRAAGYLE